MKIEIISTPVFKLPLTMDHVAVLVTLAGLHYDGKCQAASRDHLSRWDKALAWQKMLPMTANDPVSASFDEIDNTLKILEMRSAAHRADIINDDEMLLMDDLAHGLHDAVGIANKKYSEWKVTVGT